MAMSILLLRFWFCVDSDNAYSAPSLQLTGDGIARIVSVMSASSAYSVIGRRAFQKQGNDTVALTIVWEFMNYQDYLPFELLFGPLHHLWWYTNTKPPSRGKAHKLHDYMKQSLQTNYLITSNMIRFQSTHNIPTITGKKPCNSQWSNAVTSEANERCINIDFDGNKKSFHILAQEMRKPQHNLSQHDESFDTVRSYCSADNVRIISSCSHFTTAQENIRTRKPKQFKMSLSLHDLFDDYDTDSSDDESIDTFMISNWKNNQDAKISSVPHDVCSPSCTEQLCSSNPSSRNNVRIKTHQQRPVEHHKEEKVDTLPKHLKSLMGALSYANVNGGTASLSWLIIDCSSLRLLG